MSGFAESCRPPGSRRRLQFEETLQPFVSLPPFDTGGQGSTEPGLPVWEPAPPDARAALLEVRPRGHPPCGAEGPPGSSTRRERRHGTSQRRTGVTGKAACRQRGSPVFSSDIFKEHANPGGSVATAFPVESCEAASSSGAPGTTRVRPCVWHELLCGKVALVAHAPVRGDPFGALSLLFVSPKQATGGGQSPAQPWQPSGPGRRLVPQRSHRDSGMALD